MTLPPWAAEVALPRAGQDPPARSRPRNSSPFSVPQRLGAGTKCSHSAAFGSSRRSLKGSFVRAALEHGASVHCGGPGRAGRG